MRLMEYAGVNPVNILMLRRNQEAIYALIVFAKEGSPQRPRPLPEPSCTRHAHRAEHAGVNSVDVLMYT